MGIAVVLFLVASSAPATCSRSSGSHDKKGDETSSEMHFQEGSDYRDIELGRYMMKEDFELDI